MSFNQILDLVMYSLYYGICAFIGVYYWRDIWKAACGGNGIPQPEELAKLVALIAFTVDVNEILFRDKETDVVFMGMILGVMGVSSLPKNIKIGGKKSE